MEGAARIQAAYQGKIERGETPGYVRIEEGLIATQFLMNAYETYQYRLTYFDTPLVSQEFGAVQHHVIRLREQRLSLPSDLFSRYVICCEAMTWCDAY